MEEERFVVEPDDVGKQDTAKLVPQVIAIVFKSGTIVDIRCLEFSVTSQGGAPASTFWRSDLGRGDDQLLWLDLSDVSAVFQRGVSK